MGCPIELKQSKTHGFLKLLLCILYSEWENDNETATSSKIVKVYVF